MSTAEDKMTRVAWLFTAFLVLATAGLGYAIYRVVLMFWQIGSVVL